MRTLILMIQFMTRYPIPLEIDFTVERFVSGMKWMPLIGLLVGTFPALIFMLLHPLLGLEPSILFAILGLVTVTGGLHVDGLADAADGLFSYRPRERMLEIMRDSTLGTNGVIAVVLSLGLKIVLVQNLPLAVIIPALLTAPTLGRMALTWHSALSPYARDSGGMGAYVNSTALPQALAATAVSLVILLPVFFFSGLRGAVFFWFLLGCHILAITVACLFTRHVYKKLGGVTGDTIGATNELVEIATFSFFLFFWNNIL